MEAVYNVVQSHEVVNYNETKEIIVISNHLFNE